MRSATVPRRWPRSIAILCFARPLPPVSKAPTVFSETFVLFPQDAPLFHRQRHESRCPLALNGHWPLHCLPFNQAWSLFSAAYWRGNSHGRPSPSHRAGPLCRSYLVIVLGPATGAMRSQRSVHPPPRRPSPVPGAAPAPRPLPAALMGLTSCRHSRAYQNIHGPAGRKMCAGAVPVRRPRHVVVAGAVAS